MTVEKTVEEPEPVRRISGARTAGILRSAPASAEGAAKPDAAASPAVSAAKPDAAASPAASAATVPAGKTDAGNGNGDRFGGVRPEPRQGTVRPEAAVQSEVKGAEDKAADRKTETTSSSAGRQDPGKGRSRRRNVAQRVEERPEAVLTTHAQPLQPVAEEIVTAGSGHESPKKTDHPAEPVSASQSAVSGERGAEASHPIVEVVNREIIDLIATSITDLADENGWAFLGDVGTLIAKKKPDFDPRNYGFVKLTPLIRSLDMFELDIRETSQFHIKHVYVRNRKRPND